MVDRDVLGFKVRLKVLLIVSYFRIGIEIEVGGRLRGGSGGGEEGGKGGGESAPVSPCHPSPLPLPPPPPCPLYPQPPKS